MDQHMLIALLTFGVVSSFTPGPNNLMLMASGANFGVVRTLPHMMGVIIGFSLMILIVGLGLAGLFQAWPPAMTILKVFSVLYTLWLAWKIAHAGHPHEQGAGQRPMTFVQAGAFQWINPKAWSMALTAITLYAADETLRSILIVSGVFGLIGFGSTGSWMVAGVSIRRWLSSDARLRAYNYTMAGLLVGSIALAI